MKRALLACLLATCARAADMDDQFLFSNQIIREWNSSDFPVVSKRGQQALQINADAWQHLQSAHFVLHFLNKGVALRTAQEAEFYLQKMRAAMDITNDDPKRRSHIFIFEREEDWKTFTKTATIDPWTGGFFDGLDLFYWRKTGLGVLHSGSTLPHEIAHRVIYEKYPAGTIPLALNEGLAEYEARKLAFRYLRPRGYDVRIISKRVPRNRYLSADQLVAASKYPANDDDVVSFYDESERLVNLLVEKGSLEKFRDLLQALTNGDKFSLALLRVYVGDYLSSDDFERKLQEYAIDDKAK